MSTAETFNTIQTLADLLDQLGGVSPSRVRLHPLPGSATEQDVVETEQRENMLCELVDGVLVEKAMGYRESLLAGAILTMLREFVNPKNLGLVTGADGLVRLFTGLVRIPDVAFTSWDRLPDGKVPEAPIPELAPDLAVEVLSKGNTPSEINRKLGEYFSAGVRLAWIVDPDKRDVSVYTSLDQSNRFGEGEYLHGGDVLPGFNLDLTKLFSELDRRKSS